jgi:lysozyme
MAFYRTPGCFCQTNYGDIDDGTLVRQRTCSPDDLYSLPLQAAASDKEYPAAQFEPSEQCLSLLKSIEVLRLKPYDDHAPKDALAAWNKRATIGYGHLIRANEWNTYKDGIDKDQADDLFETDGAKYIGTVQTDITAEIMQYQFDALIILTYNIGGEGLAKSTVARLINSSESDPGLKKLETAWKSFNKSRDKDGVLVVNKGLVNRRKCEWDIYTRGIYNRW